MKSDIYNPQFVKSLFNGMSSSYERMNFITSFGFSIRWRRQSVQRINAPGKTSVLDLLTGMGEMWPTIIKNTERAKITALDFSEEMLKRAETINRRKFNNSIDLRLDDILENSLPSDHFDLVVCAFGLKTFDQGQIRRLAEEVRRILKPGGQFTFVEVSVPPNPVLSFLYGLYLGRIIPILGWLFLGNPSEYRMLWEYTKKFENAGEAAEQFRMCGLKATYARYFYGCASGFYGEK